MTNGSPGSVVEGLETGENDLIAPGVMDPDGSDKSDDLPPIPNPCLNGIRSARHKNAYICIDCNT